jgi:hypothetical protein
VDTPNDLFYEMQRRALSEETVDRLLAGAIAPDDAPPELSEAARILRAAAAPPEPRELTHEEATVTAFAATVRSETARRRRARTAVRTRRTALLAAALLLAGAGIAVASDGLPNVADEVAHEILEEIGVTLPEPAGGSGGDVAPAATGEEISEIATSPDTTGLEKGSEVASTASGGMSETGTDVAEESVEDAGNGQGAEAGLDEGTDTADEASGGASEVGTDAAEERTP